MSSISIVVPCYNQARYLGQAIESALRQTRPAAEVLVIDDGSTDDTAVVAARYFPNIRYIRQSNQGLSGARNTGIRAAQGDYVGFLDSDDLWLPNFINTLSPMLDANPSLGAVYGGSQFVDESLRPLVQRSTRVVPPNQLHDALVDGEWFPPCCVLARRSAFDRVGLFVEMLRASEDWEMWLRISADYPIAGTSEIVSLYRMHSDNMTRDPERMYQSQLAVARKHFGPDEGDPATWPLDRQRVYAGIYLWQAMAHYRRGEVPAGAQFVKRMLVTSPLRGVSLDTFYALGCADQPIGDMGNVRHLNLEQNARRLLDALSELFAKPGVPTRIESERSTIFGTAYFALGLLAYNSSRLGLARNWLLQGIRYRPDLGSNPQWLGTFAKSMLGTRIRELLRGKKTSIQPGY